MYKNNKSKNKFKNKESKKQLSFLQKDSTSIGLSLLNRISKNKRLSKKFESHSNVITSNPLNTGFLAHKGRIIKINEEENKSETSEELVRSSVMTKNNLSRKPKDLPQHINRSSAKTWKYPDTKEVSKKISPILDEPYEIDYLTLLKGKLAEKLKKSCESVKRQQHGLSPFNSNCKETDVKPHCCCCQKNEKNVNTILKNDKNQNLQFDRRLTRHQSLYYNPVKNLQPYPIKMAQTLHQRNSNSNKNETFFNCSGVSLLDDGSKISNKINTFSNHSDLFGRNNGHDRNRIIVAQENILSPNISSFNLRSKSFHKNVTSPLIPNLFAPSTFNEPIFNAEPDIFNNCRTTNVNEAQNVSRFYNGDALYCETNVKSVNNNFISLQNKNSPLFDPKKFF